MAFMGHRVSMQQWIGYSIAMFGLLGYKMYAD